MNCADQELCQLKCNTSAEEDFIVTVRNTDLEGLWHSSETIEEVRLPPT